MLVYLLRHGRASGLGAGVATDAQRFLTDEGKTALEAAVLSYASLLRRPDRILHSPYLRAQQSAEVLARGLGFEGALEPSPKLLSEADPTAILPDLSAAIADQTEAIALVGHEPHIGRLLGMLVTGSQASIPMSVGMLAAIEVEGSTTLWGKLLFARVP